MTLWKIYNLLILVLPLLLLVIILILLVVYFIFRLRKYREFIREYPLPLRNRRKRDEHHLLTLNFYSARFIENQQQIYDMKFKIEMEELKQADDMLIKNITTILIPVVSVMAALLAISISLKDNTDYSSGIISMSGFLVFSLSASFIDMVRIKHLEQIRIRLKYINQVIQDHEKKK
ncbi:hypothetical protein L3476_10965 [Paenibacillus thiaminolyticus]|uniref:hypothetical protein n=1 Tax=Paenibacillus thiaminolyticus TaxID=49283 RepID=UPI001163B964|nr:hypothetical protein [Paenibacillus thiaminolyticus]NGP62446.1 hypothetical protein [Paenibacillus thiaminolyticus]WCR29187.1 hypothetical protein L3476_10965 [Paenibacillus thiaminolyticus]